jgi:hypothetical protein
MLILVKFITMVKIIIEIFIGVAAFLGKLENHFTIVTYIVMQ